MLFISKPERWKGLLLVSCFYFYLILCWTTDVSLCQQIQFFFIYSSIYISNISSSKPYLSQQFVPTLWCCSKSFKSMYLFHPGKRQEMWKKWEPSLATQPTTTTTWKQYISLLLLMFKPCLGLSRSASVVQEVKGSRLHCASLNLAHTDLPIWGFRPVSMVSCGCLEKRP